MPVSRRREGLVTEPERVRLKLWGIYCDISWIGMDPGP